MRLTLFSDYSLRVLIYLGIKGGELATVGEIAEAYGISRNHLMKVVNKLTRAALIESSRGVNGGLILARPATEITVGEVVRRCEDDLGLVECFRPTNQCVITPECELKKVFGHALEEFMGVLDQYTVADLIAPESKLRRRLKIPA